ncbi:hypothetical protein [Rhodococcus sp. R1101]|uniref:hypothetical protein n=1 Tax=Rhodococcus sp. R1101 TaxID=1170698 RepID=UPI000372B44A|nr:hypothetical protein [Rhodococcus sp. R1101]
MTVDPATAAPLESPADVRPRRGLVALLVLDGALCALLSVFYLGLYIAGMPFPITILLAGLANLLLVVAVRAETGSLRSATLPLVAWAVVFLVCLAGGPGGDQLALGDWRTLLLPVAALAPAGGYLFSARIKEITRAVGAARAVGATQPEPRP